MIKVCDILKDRDAGGPIAKLRVESSANTLQKWVGGIQVASLSTIGVGLCLLL